MALNLTTLLLVLAITFMHSIFGVFSGVINVFCTIISVVVALGFYEAVNDLITSNFGLHPGYTEPICLVGLFLVTIIVVRTLADNYIRGNVKVPAIVDWGGGAVCGFINAQLFVGTIVLGVLMLPMRNPEKGTVIGFARFARIADEQDFEHPDLARFERFTIWTRSDEFTVGLFNMISGGSMRGETTFASVYPDFSEAIFFSTNTVQAESTASPYRKERGRDVDGFKKGLTVDGWWEETAPVEGRYRKQLPTRRKPRPDYEAMTFKPAAGKKLIATRLILRSAAADRERRQRTHLFRPTMLRLVGASRGDPEHYVPRIIANADQEIDGKHRIVDYDNNFSIPADEDVTIYAYFEVDEDFKPAFVEYRRHARAALADQPLEEPAEVELTLKGGPGEAAWGRSSGRQTFGSVLEANSGDWPKLPFAITRRALRGAGDVTLDGDKFAWGRVFGKRSRLEPSEDQPGVEEFKLPNGKRLIQVRYKPKEARTLVGQVFNFVAQINQYYIVDKKAERYPLVGYYAIVTRGSEQYLELFYSGGPDTEFGAAYNGMLDFKELKRSEINDQDDTVISLLFLVPPNTEFKRVQNQKGDGGDVRIQSRGG